MSSTAKPTPAQVAERRQRELEAAFRMGFIVRRDAVGRNPFDRPALSEAVQGKVWEPGMNSQRAYTPDEQAKWVNDEYYRLQHQRQTWEDGHAYACALAASGKDLHEVPLYTVRPVPKKTGWKFTEHPALFGEEDAPAVKPKKLDDGAKLHRWRGTKAVPTLADEQ